MNYIDQLDIDDHKAFANDLICLALEFNDMFIDNVSVEEHPENDNERRAINITMNDDIDSEDLAELLAYLAFILHNSGAYKLYDGK
tara:strand:- start:34 stop:291 length:258 start_codon:yes stop_codon:yes gene_type:complete